MNTLSSTNNSFKLSDNNGLNNETIATKAIINNESGSPKGSKPLSLNIPSYVKYLDQTPKHSKYVAVFLKCAVEYVACVAQFVFYAVTDFFNEKCFGNRRYTLFTYERLNADHLQAYFNKFNDNHEDNGAVFTNPIYGILEGFGDNWAEVINTKAGPRCHFDHIMNELMNDHKYLNEANLPLAQARVNLSAMLAKNQKNILAMPININQKHWTVLHFNFQKHEISFVDSKGHVTYDKETRRLIRVRLYQATEWAKKTYGGPWAPTANFCDDESSLSEVTQRLQYDKWNCGHQMIQLTYLVAKEKMSYADISVLPFEKIEQLIKARRADVIATVNEAMSNVNI